MALLPTSPGWFFLALAALAPGPDVFAQGTSVDECGIIWAGSIKVYRNFFNVGRTLNSIVSQSHPGLSDAIMALRSGSRWLDIGTGKAYAPGDYLLKEDLGQGLQDMTGFRLPPFADRAQVTGIAIKMPNEIVRILEDGSVVRDSDAIRGYEATGKFKYIETSLRKFAESHHEQFDLVTDFRGATTYSPFDLAVAEVWQVMKDGAEAYFTGDSMIILDETGRHLPVTDYLNRSTGLKAEVQTRNPERLKEQMDPEELRYGDSRYSRVQVVKTGGTLRLPELKILEAYDSQDLGVITYYRLTGRWIEIGPGNGVD